MALAGMPIPRILHSSTYDPSDARSPTARDLVSATDHWKELEQKCAKMERASMRISSIDLSVRGNEGVFYCFGVDEDRPEEEKPPFVPTLTPRRSLPSARTVERGLHGPPSWQPQGASPAHTSDMLLSPSEPAQFSRSTAGLQVADPAVMEYFRFVEGVLQEDEELMEGSLPHVGQSSPGGSSVGILRKMTSGFSEFSVESSTIYRTGTMSSEPGIPSYRSGVTIDRGLSNLAPSNLHKVGSEISGSLVEEDVHTPPSPPWRRLQAPTWEDSCDELMPSNASKASSHNLRPSQSGSGKRRGKLTLKGLLKGKSVT